MVRFSLLPALALASELRLNQIRLKGTHNSYHVEPARPFVKQWRYTHAPIGTQLEEQSVRSLELDVHFNPKLDPPLDLKVFHLPIIDDVTTCETLYECLSEVKTWSDANPYHVPVWCWIEVKEEFAALDPSEGVLDAIDRVIRTVFQDESSIITPSTVKGNEATLHSAIQTNGWPTLDDSRGKVAFVLLKNSQEYIDAYEPDQYNRPMFMNCKFNTSQPWPDYCAVTKKSDLSSENGMAVSTVSYALDDNMIVATNVCTAKDEDSEDCYRQLQIAWESGTHQLFDDFPAPVDGFDYYMPDSVFGCNDVVLKNYTESPAPECSKHLIKLNTCGGTSKLTNEPGDECPPVVCGVYECSADNKEETVCNTDACVPKPSKWWAMLLVGLLGVVFGLVYLEGKQS